MYNTDIKLSWVNLILKQTVKNDFRYKKNIATKSKTFFICLRSIFV